MNCAPAFPRITAATLAVLVLPVLTGCAKINDAGKRLLASSVTAAAAYLTLPAGQCMVTSSGDARLESLNPPGVSP